MPLKLPLTVQGMIETTICKVIKLPIGGRQSACFESETVKLPYVSTHGS